MTTVVFTHTYQATWETGPNQTMSAEQHVNFTVSLTAQPRFALNSILDDDTIFSEADLEEIDQRFENQLVDFIKKIADMRPRHPATIFSNGRYIEKDILSLLGRTEDPELQQILDHLQITHPSKARGIYELEYTAKKHSTEIVNFISQKLDPNISFQNNIHRLYLSIALDYKTQELHWFYKKETYAYLTSTLLKIPLLLTEITWFILIGIISACFLLTPLIISMNLLSAQMSLIAACTAMAPWLIVLVLLVKTDIFTISSQALAYPINSAAYWIDRGIQALFHVEFFAFELSETLAKMKKNGALDTYIATAESVDAATAESVDEALSENTDQRLSVSFFQPASETPYAHADYALSMLSEDQEVIWADAVRLVV